MARQSLHQQIPEGPQERIESGSLKRGSELPYVTALTTDPWAPQVGNSTSVLDLITHAIRIASKSNSLAFRTILRFSKIFRTRPLCHFARRYQLCQRVTSLV
jgi:hypothetical protein